MYYKKLLIMFCTRVSGTISNFFINIFITNRFGSGGAGHYFTFLSWQGFLLKLFIGGFLPYSTREISIGNRDSKISIIKNSVFKLINIVLIISICLFIASWILKNYLIHLVPSEIINSLEN